MSKKKIVKKKMLKGKFYRHIDGSGGHPSLIYDKKINC